MNSRGTFHSVGIGALSHHQEPASLNSSIPRHARLCLSRPFCCGLVFLRRLAKRSCKRHVEHRVREIGCFSVRNKDGLLSLLYSVFVCTHHSTESGFLWGMFSLARRLASLSSSLGGA